MPREIQYFINSNKDEGHRPSSMKDGNDPTRRQLIRLYADYEDACRRAGVVDFAELLPVRSSCGATAGAGRALPARFRHVLVDEFRTPTRSSTTG